MFFLVLTCFFTYVLWLYITITMYLLLFVLWQVLYPLGWISGMLNEWMNEWINLVHFVQSNNHTNIILLCAPTRHDLLEWSCVNNEIKAFNRKLLKLVKPYKHVLIVTADTDRKFFTRHGLHLNNLGKEDIASKVSMAVHFPEAERDNSLVLEKRVWYKCWKCKWQSS